MTSVSWGRRPAAEQRVSRGQLVVIVLALAIGVSASVDGFVHRSIVTVDAPGDIQSLLDQHLRTLERADDFQYERTLDRQSAAHTRCMTEQFQRGAERVAELRPNRLVRLEETSRDSTLVRAYVQRRDGVEVEYVRRGQLVNLLTLPPFDFRRVSFVWYLGAPDEQEAAREALEAADLPLSICARAALESR